MHPRYAHFHSPTLALRLECLSADDSQSGKPRWRYLTFAFERLDNLYFSDAAGLIGQDVVNA